MMYIRSLKTGQELEAERKGLKKQVYCGKGVLSTPETQAMYIPRIRSDIRDPAGQPASPLLIDAKKSANHAWTISLRMVVRVSTSPTLVISRMSAFTSSDSWATFWS